MLQSLADLAIAPRPAAFRWAFAALAFVSALLLRFVLDPVLPAGFPFLTFFPAVILTAFLCGVRAGAAVAAASFLAAWLFFIPPFMSLSLTGSGALALGFFALIAGVDVVLIHVMQQALQRVRDERERNARLAESRRTLFEEMQHRTSNNLQVVSSLIAVGGSAVRDDAARAVLDDAARRLRSVASIHRLLHAPDRDGRDLGDVLRRLSDDLVSASGAAGRVSFRVRAVPLDLSPARALSVALVAAELMSNAMEHGLPDPDAGEVEVTLEEAGGWATLTVRDPGAGLPPGFTLDGANSLGLLIVRQFAQQLGGDFALEGGAGTAARLRFPLAEG